MHHKAIKAQIRKQLKTFDDLCDVPMNYIGIEEQGHEFQCAAQRKAFG